MSSSDTADDGSHNESARSNRSQDKGWGPRHAAEASSGVDILIRYSNAPTDRLMAFYAECAERYDTALIDTYSYMAPSDAVAGLVQLNLPRDAAILDAGHVTARPESLWRRRNTAVLTGLICRLKCTRLGPAKMCVVICLNWV